jgi:hypothetical protein
MNGIPSDAVDERQESRHAPRRRETRSVRNLLAAHSAGSCSWSASEDRALCFARREANHMRTRDRFEHVAGKPEREKNPFIDRKPYD